MNAFIILPHQPREGIPDQPEGNNPQVFPDHEIVHVQLAVLEPRRSCCSQFPSRACKLSWETLRGTCHGIQYVALRTFSCIGPACCQQKAKALGERLTCDFGRMKVLCGKPIEEEESRLNGKLSVCTELVNDYKARIARYEQRNAQGINEAPNEEEFPIRNAREAYTAGLQMLDLQIERLELSEAVCRLLELRRDMGWN